MLQFCFHPFISKVNFLICINSVNPAITLYSFIFISIVALFLEHISVVSYKGLFTIQWRRIGEWNWNSTHF